MYSEVCEQTLKEETLEVSIQQLLRYPEVLGDHRKWLNAEGIDTRDNVSYSTGKPIYRALKGLQGL